MERRRFLASSFLLSLGPSSSWSAPPSRLIPRALSKGDTVGLVTPASAISRSAFEKTLDNIEQLGFRVKFSDNLRVRRGFLSGTDKQRVEDLHQMYQDPQVQGIICARGGYGSARLLPLLNYDLIRNHAKPLIGYSDITALHQAIYQKAGVVGYHGPVGASDYNDFTVDHFQDILLKGKRLKISTEDPKVIRSGQAEGILAGGNLSLLSSLVGTPYEMSYRGHLLFIEEIGESVYRIDRMLTQLKQSGVLDGVNGILLGYFTNCDEEPSDPGFEVSVGLMEVFEEQFGDLGVPILAGMPFGHESHNVTLPVGISAALDTSKKGIKLLEGPTS
ncbi:MAG: LD-carboxypeptidase [Bacteroidota bacterium]